ncbi:MAG: efflux RND transporter periplasmic adaptor subunit [Acidobacteriota bacterium]|jgi:HlyD family secretion protein|nr:efflux RND transporter periplasmic adaptor subunit [Acidobacteriota bacterium]NLT33017.1 HlyD family efflux transporter periplasmic adaptor subunit [Acidobacteriota bacterium]
MTRQKQILLLALVVILAGAGYWLYRSRGGAASVGDKDLITAQRVDFPVVISATGVLEASRSVSVGPPQIRRERRFKLMRMVDEGTVVSEGDFLMEFDTSEIISRLRDETANFQRVQEERQKKRSDTDIQLKNLKLSLEQAKSDLEKLEVKLSSQVDLVSGIEIEQTRIQRDAAKRNVELLEKKVGYKTESGQLDLQISRSNEQHYRGRMDDLMDAMDSFVVRAPVAGVVIYKRNWNNEASEIGSNIFAMDAVMELPDLSSIRAKIQVDEIDSGKIKVGQEANITVDSVRGRTFTGKIVSIGTILKQATFDRPQKVIDAYLEIGQLDTQLMRPGMNLKAQIRVGEYPQVVVIPMSSIQERDGRSFVQVWKPEIKKFEWREVSLRTNDGMTAVVEAGLDANEKIRARPIV